MNNILDLDLTRALPPSLKNDPKMLALAQAISMQLQDNIRVSHINIIYAQIDELPESVLDILAYDMHVDWYDDTMPIAAKRSAIRGSVRVHKRLGTVYAVKAALESRFLKAEVKEWFQYDGKPHHFKLTLTPDDYGPGTRADAIKTIYPVKRLSSHLDSIDLISETPMPEAFIHVGGALFSGNLSTTVLPQLKFEYHFKPELLAVGKMQQVSETDLPLITH